MFSFGPQQPGANDLAPLGVYNSDTGSFDLYVGNTVDKRNNANIDGQTLSLPAQDTTPTQMFPTVKGQPAPRRRKSSPTTVRPM